MFMWQPEGNLASEEFVLLHLNEKVMAMCLHNNFEPLHRLPL